MAATDGSAAAVTAVAVAPQAAAAAVAAATIAATAAKAAACGEEDGCAQAVKLGAAAIYVKQ